MKYPILGVLSLIILLGFGCAETQVAKGEGPEKSLFEKKCSLCHSLQRPLSKTKTREGWQETVTRMIADRGASITGEEAEMIIDYLTKYYGK